jgi:hypothetical protein
MVYGVGPQRQSDACGVGKEVPFKPSSVNFPSDKINTAGHSRFPGDLRDDQHFLVNQRHLSEFPRTTVFILEHKKCQVLKVVHRIRFSKVQSYCNPIFGRYIVSGMKVL